MTINIIDIVILVLVVTAALREARRGFLISVTRLLAGLVAVLVAFRINGILSQFLAQQFGWSQSIGMLVSFVAIWLSLDYLLSVLIRWALHPTQRLVHKSLTLRQIDMVLAALLGSVRGLLVAVMLLLPFVVTPFVPPVTLLVQESLLGRTLTPVARSVFVAIEPLIGRVLDSGLITVAPPQRDQTRTDLGFRVTDALTVDDQAEQQMLELINRERTQRGLPALVFDTQLRDVARAHSREMFQLGYFAHESPVTGSPADRVRRAGIPYLITGENLAYAPTLKIAHEGLMNSPGHRANILSPQYGRVGIGVISSPGRGKMYTQNFRN